MTQPHNTGSQSFNSGQPGHRMSADEVAKLYAGQRYEDWRGKEYLSGIVPSRYVSELSTSTADII